MEHLIIGLKLLMGLFIRDKPDWVVQDEQERPVYEESIRETIELMKEDFENKGGVLLERKVEELKKEKR